ncbi:hypothetical protein [Streptomyces chumphonensis]|uniref:hypothetical protein n=1 Tax=Streptomyces chumphonensis TaxID=1214925 RepID=UPI003D7161E8
MRGTTIAALGTTIALVCAALAGCGDGRDPAAGEAPPGRELTDREKSRLDRAEELLVARCMAEHGFRYTPSEPADAEAGGGGGYVLDDVEWAREHGYGGELRRKVLTARKDNPNLTYRASLSKDRLRAYTAALGGRPSEGMLSVELPGGGTIRTARGGCRATAQEELYGDRETWFRVDKVHGNLAPLYLPDLVQDERFTDAVEAWARCMRAAGHDYAEPPHIRAQLPTLTEGLSARDAHDVEVGLAVAEATCARDTGLAHTARALHDEYRAPVAQQYAEQLTTHHHMRLAALKQAKRVISSQA